ncbi:MAG: hypothetical protein WCW52_07055 [Elusimicrobiales bacterium]|jgi:hypothetical protein
MKNKTLVLIFAVLAAAVYPSLPVHGAGGSPERVLLNLINEGYFSSPEGKLILYRGIGSTDSAMGNHHSAAPSQREFRKWLDPGGPAAGMASDNDEAPLSFTVSLAYAGRYTGVQAWDNDRGVIRLEIPMDKLRAMRVVTGRVNALPANTWALLYDTPASAESAGFDVYDRLPFIGTVFSDKDGTIRTLCPPATLLDGGGCPALEARLSIGTLKKLGNALSIRRVTWAEYDAARKSLLDRKASIMRLSNMTDEAGLRQASRLWNAEANFYSLLCAAGAEVCPNEPADGSKLCARLLALPKKHYLLGLRADSPANLMMIELVRKKTGPIFHGVTLSAIADECRTIR